MAIYIDNTQTIIQQANARNVEIISELAGITAVLVEKTVELEQTVSNNNIKQLERIRDIF